MLKRFFKRLLKKLEVPLMALFALAARVLFLLYSAVVNLVGLALLFVWALCLYVYPPWRDHWWAPVLVIMALGGLHALSRPGPPKDNPFRRYLSLMNKCNDGLIAWIGTIKYFCSPISLVEDPGSYKIKGTEIRELIDSVLQPGDILLRGYDGYLDGIMIRLSGNGAGLGKYFSHAALYLGEVKGPDDRAIAARRLQTMDASGSWIDASDTEKEAIRSDPRYYQEGRQMVVHAMTRGVFVEDILTFLRCDYLAVLRLHDRFALTEQDRARDRSLIKHLPDDAEAIHARLMQGGDVGRNEVFDAARRSALGKIGSCYDFQFNDIRTANRFSCSEFVYYCYKSIHSYLGLEPKDHSFLGCLFERHTITPADVYDAAVAFGKLEVKWTSGSVQKE